MQRGANGKHLQCLYSKDTIRIPNVSSIQIMGFSLVVEWFSISMQIIINKQDPIKRHPNTGI